MEMLKGAEQGFKDNYALLKKLSEMRCELTVSGMVARPRATANAPSESKRTFRK